MRVKKIKNLSPAPLVFLAIGAIALSISGCETSLDAKPDGAGQFLAKNSRIGIDEDVRVGVDYALPMLQFKLLITRTLTQCQDEKKGISVRFLAKVNAETHYVAGERFVINYETLASWSKTSKFELQTYDNGVIKSLNAEADDQSAAIIGDVVKSGFSIISLASGVPLGNKSLPPPGEMYWACSPETLRIIDSIDQYETDLKTKTKELTTLNDKVAGLEHSAAMLALSEDGKKRLEKLKEDIKATANLVKEIDDNLEGMVGRVSVIEEVIWPNAPSILDLDASPSPGNKKKLLSLFSESADHIGGYKMPALEAKLQLSGKLVRMSDAATQEICPANAATVDDKAKCKLIVKEAEGIFYRSPVPARLLICQSTGADCSRDAATAVIVSDAVLAPQLGNLRLLPYSNGMFQNNTLTVAFRENGGISKLNVDEKSARGKSLSSAVSTGLDSVLAYRDAKVAFESEAAESEKKTADEKAKAELDKLDHEIALLDKQQKIESMREEVSETASLKDTKVATTRLTARLAYLEAQKNVRDAEEALAKMDENAN